MCDEKRNDKSALSAKAVCLQAQAAADANAAGAIEELLAAKRASFPEGSVAGCAAGSASSASLPQAGGGLLGEDKDGLFLEAAGMRVRADFSHLQKRLRKDRLASELLIRAAKLRPRERDAPLFAIDATAGFGEDAFLLAASGFSVRMYERDPVIAAMLDEALRAAANKSELASAASRMELVFGDSIEALRSLASRPDIIRPDVIYLDPMFALKTKNSAAKKKLHLLQQVVPPCTDAADLISAAQNARPRKIIIKRPLKGSFLADVRPDYSLFGHAVRFDVIAFS